MNKEDKYLNEEKYRIEIKGITHDWMSLDKAKFDPIGKRYSQKEAEDAIKKAIKAGRSPKTIRMVKESNDELDIIDRLEIENLIRETKEYLDDEEMSEKALALAGWTKGSIEKFGKTIGVGPEEHGFFDTCKSRMKGKRGWDQDKAEGFCAKLIDTTKGTTKWREEKEEK